MKRIEAVMKENGKAATPGTAIGNRMNDKTVASSNFTSESQGPKNRFVSSAAETVANSNEPSSLPGQKNAAGAISLQN